MIPEASTAVDLSQFPAVYSNLAPARLVEEAVRRNEGKLTRGGALNTLTGDRTGRSPRDKFLVDDPAVHDRIWWGAVNQPISSDVYQHLRERCLAWLRERAVFVFDGSAGADPAHSLPLRVITSHAWAALFVPQLFIRRSVPFEPDDRFTVIHAPELQADPQADRTRSAAFVITNLADRTILIGGTQYAGEIKKSVFGVMNYFMPEDGVFPMHCSANSGLSGDTALFFGLSGTGKTTLSADPGRLLIGDDEHGWSSRGVFNFEGGCYAKCVGLNRERERQIWEAIRFGAVLENVVVDPDTRVPHFDDVSLTENTRAAYPLDFIPHAIESGCGAHPRNVMFLAYDAFGVLPPIAKLTPEQTLYHFLSGYTARVAGTETGTGREPMPEFSTCFAHPFLPRPPAVYAGLLADRLAKHRPDCWLVNTGLSGGPYGVGKRMDIEVTRAIVSAALSGSLAGVSYTADPFFGVLVPETCPGVPASLLQARSNWSNGNEYDAAARRLVTAFQANMEKLNPADRGMVERGGPPAYPLSLPQ